jgi:hypothetical protein
MFRRTFQSSKSLYSSPLLQPERLVRRYIPLAFPPVMFFGRSIRPAICDDICNRSCL